MRRFAAGIACIGLLVIASATVAQVPDSGAAGSLPEGPVERDEGEVSNVVQELSQELYSPYCPGKTVAMCPSGGASRLRRSIQEMARRGMTKRQIKERILEKHGEEFRFEEPPAEDNYPLLALIVAALLACGGAVWWFSRGSSDGPDDDTSDSEDWSDEDEVYLDEIRRDYQQ